MVNFELCKLCPLPKKKKGRKEKELLCVALMANAVGANGRSSLRAEVEKQPIGGWPELSLESGCGRGGEERGWELAGARQGLRTVGGSGPVTEHLAGAGPGVLPALWIA